MITPAEVAWSAVGLLALRNPIGFLLSIGPLVSAPIGLLHFSRLHAK